MAVVIQKYIKEGLSNYGSSTQRRSTLKDSHALPRPRQSEHGHVDRLIETNSIKKKERHNSSHFAMTDW